MWQLYGQKTGARLECAPAWSILSCMMFKKGRFCSFFITPELLLYAKRNTAQRAFRCQLSFLKSIFWKQMIHIYVWFTQVTELLDNMNMMFVRRAGRRWFRAMDTYRKGLEGPLVDYALKVYSSHRRISNDPVEIENLKRNFCAKTWISIVFNISLTIIEIYKDVNNSLCSNISYRFNESMRNLISKNEFTHTISW